MRNIPINAGASPTIYLRDVATVEDAMDIPSGYALVNGRRAIYMLVTKRADASTLAVVNEVKAALPRMQKELPDDIQVSFEFDQSPVVTRSIRGLATEAALGAMLTGLMVLVFLRDWRSVLVVVLNIPLALASAVIALWLTGQTINLMTLGGLALAVGILVDEATVEIENIHTQMTRAKSIARAVRLGNAQTAVPRLLAMLCILAVFHSVVLHARGGAGAVRADVAGRRLLDGGLVHSVQHVRAGGFDLAAAAREPRGSGISRGRLVRRLSGALSTVVGVGDSAPRAGRRRLSRGQRGGHRSDLAADWVRKSFRSSMPISSACGCERRMARTSTAPSKSPPKR